MSNFINTSSSGIYVVTPPPSRSGSRRLNDNFNRLATLANQLDAATSADVPNTLVQRDGSGNFAAGTIVGTAFNINTSGVGITQGSSSGQVRVTGGLGVDGNLIAGDANDYSAAITAQKQPLGPDAARTISLHPSYYDGELHQRIAFNFYGLKAKFAGASNGYVFDSSVTAAAFIGDGSSLTSLPVPSISAVIGAGNDAGNQDIVNLANLSGEAWQINSIGYIEANYFYVGGLQVVCAQQGAIADTDTDPTNLQDAVNAILAALRTHGLIAT